MTTPAPAAAPPATGPQLVFDHVVPPVPALAPVRLRLLFMLGLLGGFTALTSTVFGAGWMVVGLLGMASVIAYDEAMRFARNRFRIRITGDGELIVDRWNGEQRHWLPLAKEARLVEFRHTGADQFDGNIGHLGTGYRVILTGDSQPDARITLPGGQRFFPGSGPNMDAATREELVGAMGQFVKAR